MKDNFYDSMRSEAYESSYKFCSFFFWKKKQKYDMMRHKVTIGITGQKTLQPAKTIVSVMCSAASNPI